MNPKRLSLIGNYFILLFIVFGTGLISILFIQSGLTVFLQIVVIAYFSFLPAWIFLQFNSTKGKTLWDEYVLNLYRLRIDHSAYLPKPPKYSLYFQEWQDSNESIQHLSKENDSDTYLPLDSDDPTNHNIYRKKFESLYGVAPIGEYRFSNNFRKLISQPSEHFFMGPVMISTLIITIGWALVVEPRVYLTLAQVILK